MTPPGRGRRSRTKRPLSGPPIRPLGAGSSRTPSSTSAIAAAPSSPRTAGWRPWTLRRAPPTTLTLLAQAARAGAHIGTLCDTIHRRDGPRGVRRILGVLGLVKKHGPAVVEDACAAALELQVADYRFVRRYLERPPAAPLTLRQVDPLIRDLTHYRDVIARKTQEEIPT